MAHTFYHDGTSEQADPLCKKFMEFDNDMWIRLLTPSTYTEEKDLVKMHEATARYTTIRQELFNLVKEVNDSYFCNVPKYAEDRISCRNPRCTTNF